MEGAIRAAASISRLGNLEAAGPLVVPIADRVHASIIRAAGDLALPTADIEKAFTRLDDLESKRAQEVEHLVAERVDIERELPPSLVVVSRMLAAVKQFCEAISSHANAVEALSRCSQELEVGQRWQKFICDARDSFCVAEAKLANERITKIKTEYQTLFGHLVRGGPNVLPEAARTTTGAEGRGRQERFATGPGAARDASEPLLVR
jgi:hypothetical protein